MTKAFLLLFIFSQAQAQLVSQSLTWTEEKKNPSTSDLSLSFVQQKKMETGKKWAECAALGKNNFAKSKSSSSAIHAVRPWIFISWLRCGRELYQETKSIESLQLALKSLENTPEFFSGGPWRNGLFSEVLKSRFFLVDFLKKNNATAAWAQIELLSEQKDRMDRTQRAQFYEQAGELSQIQAQLAAAQFFYEESLKEQESKSAREKLSSILFAIASSQRAVGVPKPEESKKGDFLNEAEEKFEERIKSSLKTHDLITLLEDCVDYTVRFPSGRRAKWADGKIFEIYTSFLEKSDDPASFNSLKSLRERALSLMEKADFLRQMDWARQLHRKSDFVGSLRLSEKALEKLSQTSSGAILLYIAGRSAQFSGDYKKAKKYFEQYLEKNSGGEDVNEVLFRLGLVHLRLGKASSAIANFEKLLVLKGNDRYELSSRYWLIRSLQAMNNNRALKEIDVILEKYPFSYYGLRLRLEKAGGFLEWPMPLKVEKNLKANFFLLSHQQKNLQRAQFLAQNGWLQEAFSEVTELPVPNDAVGKVLYAKKLTEMQIFPQAIRLINEAGDIDPSLRALDVISLSFPLVHKELIEVQAQKQKLSPFLIRSLIRQESAFGVKAVSSSSAFGLMQLIGPTAQEVATELGLRNVLIPEDIYAPETNVQMGSYYIAKMIRRFGGNVPMGLAAYNAGPSKMQAFVQAREEMREAMVTPSSDPKNEIWFDEIPWFETSFYIKAILRNTMLYKVTERTLALNSDSQPDQGRVEFGPVLWSDLLIP